MLVSVTCSSGHLAKIHNDGDNLGWKHNDRDNLGWKEENKQINFFLSHICNINLFVDIKYMYLYILSLINLLNRQQN